MVGWGVFICCFGTLHIKCNEDMNLINLLAAMRFNVIVSGTVIVIGIAVLCHLVIGNTVANGFAGWRLFGAFTCGLVAGVLIGWVTE